MLKLPTRKDGKGQEPTELFDFFKFRRNDQLIISYPRHAAAISQVAASFLYPSPSFTSGFVACTSFVASERTAALPVDCCAQLMATCVLLPCTSNY